MRRFRSALLVLLASAVFLSGPWTDSKGTHVSQPVLGVWPESASGFPGSTLAVAVNITEVVDLVAVEFVLTYDGTVLNATSVTLAGGIFDRPDVLVLSLDVSVKPHVSVAAVLLGSNFNGSGAVAFMTFTVLTIGTSVLDLHDDTLINLQLLPITHTTIDGFFLQLQVNASLVGRKAWAAYKNLDIGHYGAYQNVSAKITNDGIFPVWVYVGFKVVSSISGEFSVKTDSVQLIFGDTVIVSTSYPVQPIPENHFVTATVWFSADGVNYAPGNSKTFTYSVAP